MSQSQANEYKEEDFDERIFSDLAKALLEAQKKVNMYILQK